MANFVETEQLVEIKGPAGTLLSSYVQVHLTCSTCPHGTATETRSIGYNNEYLMTQ